MPVYTVHAPSDPASRDETDKFVFVRDGFHVWALVFGPFWLLWHRLWLVLIAYLAGTTALGAALSLLGAGGDVRFLVFLLLAILTGLEVASLRRWSYSRGRWRQIDFVVADDEESAERRFFDRWTEGNSTGSPPSYDTTTMPWPPRTMPHAMPHSGQGIIGLFPEPGGSR